MNVVKLVQNTSYGNTTTTNQPFSPPMSILLALLSGVVSLGTVGGNVLVLSAFLVERNIRTATNYFIASLAVTDLLIGIVSMNFFTIYLLLGYWPLGQRFCDLWLSLDYTACLTSQYTVFFITVDRFCSVKIPAKYREWRTDSRVGYMVAATWIVPSTIFFTTIIGWPFFTGRRGRADIECFAEFTTYPVFNTVLTIGYFWVTLVVMCALYAGIYRVAWTLHKKSVAKRQQMTTLMAMAGHTMSRIGVGVSWASKEGTDETGYPVRRENGSQKQDVVSLRGSCHRSKVPPNDFNGESTPKQLSRQGTWREEFQSLADGKKCSVQATIEFSEYGDNADFPDTSCESIPLQMLKPPYSPISSVVSRSLNAPPEQICKLKYIDEDSDENSEENTSSTCSSEAHFIYEILPLCTTITNEDSDFASTPRRTQLKFDLSDSKNQTPNDFLTYDAANTETADSSSIGLINHTPTPVPKQNQVSFLNKPSSRFPLNEDSESRDKSYERDTSMALPLKQMAKKLTNRQRQESTNSRDGASRTENRARKALRTISLILGAFMVCWTPYHIIVLVKGFCDDPTNNKSCVNDHLYNIAYWLCYMNSPINPFCYALANAQFKTTFMRMLRCDLHRT